MSTSESNEKMFGKYKLLAHLATGGMAEVLLASHTGLANFEKLVVIKLILPHLSKEKRFIDMFLDEARIAAMLNHPNVVQVFDLGIQDGRYFIAMEYLPGESLSYLVRTMRKDGQALPPHLAAGIVMQAAEGLHHAHSAVDNTGKSLRIVHRDISPQNIFVLYDGGVKVVDFGIAKATLSTTKTRTGTLKGKYAYMSPEQILGKELDGRSDVFSLGVVLWECLTGQKLFAQQSDLKLLQSITDGDISAPAEVNPGIPWDLSNITMKALERDRSARYKSAREFRDSLSRFLKKTEEEGDTAAIAKFMHSHFAVRINKKQQLIKGTREVEPNLQDTLFGDLNSILSDTEQSIPRTPLDEAVAGDRPGHRPSHSTSGSDRVQESSASLVVPGRPIVPYVVIAVFLVLVFVGIVYFLGDENKQKGNSGSSSLPDVVALENIDAGSIGEIDTSMTLVSENADGGIVDAGAELVNKPDVRTVLASFVKGADIKRSHVKTADRKKRKMIRKKRNNTKMAADEHLKNEDNFADTSKMKENGGSEKEHKSDASDSRETGTGILRLSTDPWVDVYLGEKKIGQTPLVDVEVPVGNIKMRAVNKEAGIDKMFFVRIKQGKRTIKRLNFF